MKDGIPDETVVLEHVLDKPPTQQSMPLPVPVS